MGEPSVLNPFGLCWLEIALSWPGLHLSYPNKSTSGMRLWLTLLDEGTFWGSMRAQAVLRKELGKKSVGLGRDLSVLKGNTVFQETIVR